MILRTDLAVEAREIAGEDTKGVSYVETEKASLKIAKLKVKNSSASRKLKKEIGTYITIDLPPLTDNVKETDERLFAIGDEIRRLLPVNGLVLVVGLGNKEITPDALGPYVSSRILATRHIEGEVARSTGLDKLRPVAVLSTGVTGQTGIETGEYVLSIVNRIKPSAIVCIDALASRRLSRLGTTLQICDTGISPGEGVMNHRTKISKDTMGVPVIAIGVPTVVDAVTMALDIKETESPNEKQRLEKRINPDGRMMVVTPKEIDLLIDRASNLIGMSLNYALQTEMELGDILSLL